DEHGFVERYITAWRLLRGPGFACDDARDVERARRIYAAGVCRDGVLRQFVAVATARNRSAALAQVVTPTLVIHGAADPLVPLAHGAATRAAIGGAELCVIAGMGHAMPVELWPELIAAIVRRARS
ncbi:MAG: alpha/beta hydrolase, partial [Verrucomicrobiota bacterium]